MDKAHKIALERLPIDESDLSAEQQNQIKREIFCSGYNAAFKEFALTWEDIAYIVDTFYAVTGNTKEKCEEVLFLFNKQKIDC